jgi:hypothetical protein
VDRFPDRLLREEPQSCGACSLYGKRHPNCTCSDPKVLPFKEQPITALFGPQDVIVYVHESQLVGLGAPQEACDELTVKLNEAFGSDEVIVCEPCTDLHHTSLTVDFAPSYATLVFFNDMAKKCADLHKEIEASVSEIVLSMQLTASVSHEEVYA